MKKVDDVLKKHEKKIIKDSYKIALAKQDIALNVIESICKVFEQESPRKFSKEEIADRVFQEIKKIPNEKIQKYIGAKLEDKPKLKLKIEKQVIRKIKKK